MCSLPDKVGIAGISHGDEPVRRHGDLLVRGYRRKIGADRHGVRRIPSVWLRNRHEETRAMPLKIRVYSDYA
jgi:hypothetical protein